MLGCCIYQKGRKAPIYLNELNYSVLQAKNITGVVSAVVITVVAIGGYALNNGNNKDNDNSKLEEWNDILAPQMNTSDISYAKHNVEIVV